MVYPLTDWLAEFQFPQDLKIKYYISTQTFINLNKKKNVWYISTFVFAHIVKLSKESDFIR